jgi:hypothetical protein
MNIARVITVICILFASFNIHAQSVTAKKISPIVSGQNANTTSSVNTKDPDSNGVAITEIQVANYNLSCFPNPAQENIQVNISTIKNGIYNLQLANIAGQTVYSSTLKLSEGQNVKTISIAELPKGMYFLSLNSASGTIQSFKIYKY